MNKEAVEYYRSLSSSVETFCQPLSEYLGISLFIYFRIYHNSTYITLSNDINLTQEYCFNVDKDSLYFQEYLENDTKSRFILWPKDPINLGTQIVFNKNYWHGLNILKLHDDYVEGCSFLSHVDNSRIHEFFIRNSNVLEKFAEYFKVVFADSIAQGSKHKAIFKSGFDFYLPKHEIRKPLDIRGFLEKIGIGGDDVKLNGKIMRITLREKQCLELMDKGYSLKEIGKELLLSHRTIETHINNIKHKTGYYYKHDLTKLYRDFLSENIPILDYGQNHE